MQKKYAYGELIKLLDSHKLANKEWFLSLLDDEQQNQAEFEHIEAVMQMMRLIRIRPHKRKIAEAEQRIQEIEEGGNPTAADVVTVRALLAEIEEERKRRTLKYKYN